ncbi:PAS-domain containing protein [Qipengyuania sp. JC766]|uniref:PAS domain-containing sensor histidine kinase n=1 Tax=Qipengyuania sp. JC766 TaxID=3232139 RepID=UPI00345A7AF8
MEFTPTALLIIGLLMAAWMGGAAWLMLHAAGRSRAAEGSRKAARRMARMIDEAPAIPLLVRADGRIEGSERLAGWLGLKALPRYLSEVATTGEGGLERAELEALEKAVQATQKTARPFRQTVTPVGSEMTLALHGALADPQVSPGGAALVWIFDLSESRGRMAALETEASEARRDFGALAGLIEAAPLPMWVRESDGRLRLVNRAYVKAVDGESAEAVVAAGTELVEPVDGLSAADVARQVAEHDRRVERIVPVTVDEMRRSFRVIDLPLGDGTVAGYAVDIEDLEEQARAFRAFREAQRSMLDQLSVGVGQFDSERKLVFANQPFQRVFRLNSGIVSQGIDFARFLSDARDNGRVPELRDFPAWRAERVDWFAGAETRDEEWPLSGGTHLRIVAQPLPDGGLVLVAEDRTEQLALAATRDTLLRTRTATFDSLKEALAVFAPDSHLQLWNRSFAGMWGLDADILDEHPEAEAILSRLRKNLADPESADEIGRTIRAATLDRKRREGRAVMADGRTLEYTGVPLPDGNGLLTVLDITDNERVETALRDRNQALEEADAVKTRFLANMSYELRTPLTSIGGYAELLQGGAGGALSASGEDYVDAILQSVARLTEQVGNVLDLSQSEAGLMPLARDPIELMPFLTGIIRERETAIAHACLDLDLRGNRTVGRVEGDRQQLARAVGHLLDNAIAGTPDGGKILVDLARERGKARIVISDNGRGMSAKELARALNADPGSRTGEDGRKGLGIPLARQLIEAHGGSLEIMSQSGLGTTAKILLP